MTVYFFMMRLDLSESNLQTINFIMHTLLCNSNSFIFNPKIIYKSIF